MTSCASYDPSDNRDLLESYDRDGYVMIRQFVAPEAFADLAARIDRFVAEVAPGMPAEHVFYEDKGDPSTLKQLQQMGDYDPWFGELLTTGPFRELAELLLRGPVAPKNLQYFNKPPGVGQATPAHQGRI